MSPSTKATGEALRRSAVTETTEAERPIEGAPREEVRGRMVAEAAYYRAEKRGFEPGAEVEDWIAAEAEIEALLREIA